MTVGSYNLTEKFGSMLFVITLLFFYFRRGFNVNSPLLNFVFVLCAVKTCFTGGAEV